MPSHLPASRPLIVLLLVLSLSAVPVRAQDPPVAQPQNPPDDPFPQAVEIPDGILDGGSEWFNTADPLTLRDLRGKIVLLDFWTYCCINCLHVLPDLKYLEEKYGNQLVVIGVHSAKFDNEKLSDNIREAIMRYEIRHPVVNDDQMIIWQKFGTRAWPTLALVDPEGRYIGSQSGEGNRELFDAVIARLIEYHRWKGTLDETPLRFELEEFRRPSTPLRYPGKVHADPAGSRLFIADTGHNRIIVTSMSGQLQHIIGSGQIGRSDGRFDQAAFDHPQGLVVAGDKLYVADTENHLIRIVDLTEQTVKTLAGTGSQGRPGTGIFGPLQSTALNSPWDVELTGRSLFIAMAGPHQIWYHEIGTDEIGVYAGSAREDVINGPLNEAAFAQPSAIVASEDGTALFVADSEGSAIRRLTTDAAGRVSTIAGTSELPRGQSLFAFGDVDGVGAAARLQHPLGLAVAGNTLYVADSYNHRIRTVSLESREVTSWLGTGRAGSGVSPVELNEPGGLSIGGNTLWIADTNNHRILAADRTTGTVSELRIEGLQPPAPRRVTTMPDSEGAIDVPAAVVSTSGPLRFSAQLSIPTGYKLNELAPVVWEVFAPDGQTIVAADQLGARDVASVSNLVASFELPLTGAAGESELLIRISWGYCSDASSVCRLADAMWKVPVTTDASVDTSEIQLDGLSAGE